MEKCPACGVEVADGIGVCPACGETVHEHTVSFEPVAVVEPAGAVAVATEGPMLVVRRGPEVGERFYLDRSRITLGRDPEADIFLNDVTVSRAHAILEIDGDEVTVCDAGSLNGVYVNGVTVDRAVLRNGDQLQIGRFQMVFLSGGAQ